MLERLLDLLFEDQAIDWPRDGLFDYGEVDDTGRVMSIIEKHSKLSASL